MDQSELGVEPSLEGQIGLKKRVTFWINLHSKLNVKHKEEPYVRTRILIWYKLLLSMLLQKVWAIDMPSEIEP
jgi:hypothetical protein